MDDVAPATVVDFWMHEVGPKRWFTGGAELDAMIRDRFAAAWDVARRGGLWRWHCSGPKVLAYLLLTDQFPRNMFRGQAQAFATDTHARAVAKLAIDKGWDLTVDEPARHFFYMPLSHSEFTSDQARAVRLMKARMPGSDGGLLLHARAHRDVIRRFGRFPFRNAALGRETSPQEQDFLDAGGYGAVVEALKG